jgi:hypothetical protein
MVTRHEIARVKYNFIGAPVHTPDRCFGATRPAHAIRRCAGDLDVVAAAMIGLLPVMGSDGTGADVVKRIAAPMIGGLVTSFVLELTIYPAIFAIWKGRGLERG